MCNANEPAGTLLNDVSRMSVIFGYARGAASVASGMQALWGRLRKSPMGVRFAMGAMWSLVAALLARGMHFASVVLVARLLGPEDYGAFAIILSTTGLFHTFAGFGLGLTATKHMAELRQFDPARCGRVMALSLSVAMLTGLLATGVMAASSAWLAEIALAAPDLGYLVRYSSIMLVLGALNGAQIGMLSGFEAFRTITTTSLLAGIAGFALVVGGVLLFHLDGAVWGSILSLAFSCIISHFAARRVAAEHRVRASWRRSWQEKNIIWQYSLPTFLSAAAAVPAQWLAGVFLVNQPGGFASMGEFSAANSIRLTIIAATSAFTQPLAPILASLRGGESRALSSFNVLLSWSIGILCVLPLLFFPQLPQMLFGSSFAGTSFEFSVMILMYAAAIYLYKDGLARVLVARGLMWWGFYSNLLWAIALVSISFITSAKGALGIAVAYAAAYAINTIVVIPLYLQRKLVPRSTLVSPEAAGIWLALSAPIFLHIIELIYFPDAGDVERIIARLIAATVSSLVIVWLLYRIAKN